MAFEQERAYVAESKAQLISYSDNELLFRKELIRYWPSDRDKLIQSTLSYLNTYGSAGNTTASQRVVDPIAGSPKESNTYSGSWRVVNNEKTSRHNEAQWPGISGIVQTLRYGFAQTLSWDEARVVNNKEMPGNLSSVTGIDETATDDPNDVVVVEWVNLDPAYTRGMLSSGILSGSTVTSPSIRGDGSGYAGVWHKVATTIGESSLEDGSGVIRVVLARPQYTLNSYDHVFNLFGSDRQGVVHYLWNVPRDIAQDIIDDWKATRREAAASLNSDDTVNIVLREFDPGTTPVSLASEVSALSCSREDTTYYYWGVTDPSVAAYDISNATSFPLASDRGYTYRKNISFNSSLGVFDVTIVEIHTVSRAPYTDWRIVKSTLSERQETLKLGQTAFPSEASSPAVVGTVEQVDLSIQDDCSIDSKLTKIISTPDTEIVSWATISGTAYKGRYQNWASGDAQDAVDSFLTTTGISPLLYRISPSHTRNADGTYEVRITASPASTKFTARTTFEGFTWWDTTLRISTRAPDDEYDAGEEAKVTPDSVYIPEYTHMAVEYWDMDSYDESDVYESITGRGAYARVSVVGNYYRLEMVIGKILESDPNVIKKMTDGIWDDIGSVQLPDAYVSEPPPV